MRLRPFPLLLLCLAGSLAGQNEDWHRYSNDAGNFSVLVPAQPQESVNPGSGTETHTIQTIANRVGYTVVYVLNTSDQKVDEPTFNIYRDAFIRSLPNCQKPTESAASPAIPGYIGRWYRFNCRVGEKPQTFIGNLYWGRRYAYAVIVIFETSPSDPPNAKKFTDSFAVLDAAR